MMLRVNNEYLDFDDVVEVEKQVKLLESIDTADGDFSYQFSLPRTINNIKILGNPQPDNINKEVYQRIDAALLNDSGAEIFKGYLRVERLKEVIDCSFFAGNNNWFGLLAGKLQDLDWSEFDTEITESNFAASIFNTEGVVMPVLDNGVLVSRGTAQLKLEDFVPGIYVKTVFQKIFNAYGIKLRGELLEDVNFNSAITVSSGKSQEDIDDRSSFVHSTNSPNPEDDTYRKVVFTDDSVFPYFDGASNNYNLALSRYVADVKMKVKVEFQIFDLIVSTGIGLNFWMAIRKNGVQIKEFYVIDTGFYPAKISMVVSLNPGDYLEGWTRNDTIIAPNPLVNVTFKVTPIYLYAAFGETIVPDWTQQQYVSNILRRFNVLASYQESRKILTLNLFEKIRSKPSINLSDYITATEIDYVEFISNYAKNSYLVDGVLEQSDDFKKLNLNAKSFYQGAIEIDNGFLPDTGNIVESEFVAPVTYINPIFDMSIEKTDLIGLEEEIKVDFTGVTSGTSGRARFSVEDGIFALSDVVRIQNSTVPSYNGDWMVFSIGTGWIEMGGMSYDANATGEASKMNFVYTDSGNVYLFHHVPLYAVSKFSGRTSFKLEATDYATLSVAFFNVIDQGRQISLDFKHAMSFADGDQISIVDQYFNVAKKVFNDPVKLFCEAYLPVAVFYQLDFLSPVHILTEETQNMYYLNRITGYKDSYYPCTLELIKI